MTATRLIGGMPACHLPGAIHPFLFRYGPYLRMRATTRWPLFRCVSFLEAKRHAQERPGNLKVKFQVAAGVIDGEVAVSENQRRPF